MNVQNDILNELRSLSELVATISRETPYRVADDYFADFSERVLIRLKTQHKPLAFNVPDGYFEGFAQNLLAKIKAGAGNEASAGLGNAAPESAAAEIAALSPLLAGLRQSGTYRLPEGYFEEVSPVLALAGKKTPYYVPEDYFHELPAGLTARVLEPVEEERTPARVISMGSRRNWWKYSAAAVVAGVILTIGWLRLHVSGGGTTAQPKVDIAATLSKTSDQELQNFLADQDTTLAQPVSAFATNQEFTDNDIKTLLGDVPDGELKQYMEEHGGTDETATN